MTILWLSETVGYLPGPVNIGVIRLGRSDALIVDAGLDEDRGKKLLRALQTEGLRPTVLFLTHSHADHFGGGALVKKRAGVLVAAPAEEAAFIRSPRLEPFSLYGLAEPPPGLRTKFLQATPLEVDLELHPGPWLPPNGDRGAKSPPTDDAPSAGRPPALELEVVDLGGHAPGQCGLRAGDLLFAADALFPPALWGKHGFVYHASVKGALAAIETIAASPPRIIIPSHGDPSEDSGQLLSANRKGLDDLSREVARVVERAAEQAAASTEDVVAVLARQWEVEFRGLPDYYLARACVQAHLSYLTELGLLEPVVKGGRLLWQPA